MRDIVVCIVGAGDCIGWIEVHIEEQQEQNAVGDDIGEPGIVVGEVGIAAGEVGIAAGEPGTGVVVGTEVGEQNGERAPDTEVGAGTEVVVL
jgi:hypothetical protein